MTAAVRPLTGDIASTNKGANGPFGLPQPARPNTVGATATRQMDARAAPGRCNTGRPQCPSLCTLLPDAEHNDATSRLMLAAGNILINPNNLLPIASKKQKNAANAGFPEPMSGVVAPRICAP